ncbi:HAD family hydrolase [Promicromonospora kroppenstedtii]|uniref:HAD family hydrolase n=1 Tax=Promicromonospora kroppenstedtii TaxID=440482 RepID=A0ABW7XRH0_9MICO
MNGAAQLLNESSVVLLDFDGPVTPLMPAPANMHAADAARQAITAHGATPPDDIATTSDHLAVLRWAGVHAPDALADVEAACTSAEVESAHACVPTPGAHALLEALYESEILVVIVSNNGESAIDTYIRRHQLGTRVYDVVGRPPMRPDLMKPDPYIIKLALEATWANTRSTVLIGDSVSDIEVAVTTGIRSIGYAKTPRRGAELREAGADAVTDNMLSLVEP